MKAQKKLKNLDPAR